MARFREYCFSNGGKKCILFLMSRKVIFFDIDGTLVDIEGRLPGSAAEAIHRAQANGALCVINTGRPFTHIVPAVTAVGFDGYVCSCGQHVLYEGKTVFRHRPDRACSRFVAETAKQCRIDLFAEAEEATWGLFYHAPGGPMRHELRRFRERGMTVYDSVEEGDFLPDKFCAWTFPDSDEETFTRAVSGRFTSTGEEGALLEFVLNGHSKKTGAEAFLALVGADRTETYALGDSINDLPMFRAVAHPIAMENSDPRLIGEAEYVTSALENDGVAQALRRFGLI